MEPFPAGVAPNTCSAQQQLVLGTPVHSYKVVDLGRQDLTGSEQRAPGSSGWSVGRRGPWRVEGGADGGDQRRHHQVDQGGENLDEQPLLGGSDSREPQLQGRVRPCGRRRDRERLSPLARILKPLRVLHLMHVYY